MIDNDTEWELADAASSLPPNMFLRYDAIIEAWLVVEPKKDAQGVKVVTHGKTIMVAVEKALASISAHTTA
jgi:hypothetical protein